MIKQTTQTDLGPHAAETQVHRQALHDLIDIGADLARQLHAQAIAQAAQQAKVKPLRLVTEAPPTPPPGPDALIKIAADFDRVASAVRRCILLAQNLDQPVQPAHGPAQYRTAARKRILRAVEDAIQRPADNPDCDDPETLHAELLDRMDAPDLDDEIADRPVPDIIKDICRDLGLAALPGTRPWKRRTPADIAGLHARAAAPSSAHPSSPGPQDGPPAAAYSAPVHSTPDPQPGHPAAIPHLQPGPARAANGLPDDPAETVATVPRHHARTDARWRLPPEN